MMLGFIYLFILCVMSCKKGVGSIVYKKGRVECLFFYFLVMGG